MGDAAAVASSEEGMEVEETVVMEKKNESSSSNVVGWERFLPRMDLRVLLVEADDSTRQIIAALLRKCSYKDVEQQKVEVTSENNSASSHSRDYLNSIPKNKECSKKGSDAQSSCTTPYLEAESACMQKMQGLLQLKCGCASNLDNTKKHEEYMKLVEESVTPKSEIGGNSIGYEPESASCNETYRPSAFSLGNDHDWAKTVTTDADSGLESQSGHAIYHTDDMGEPLSEALDLIGNFEHRPKDTYGTLSASDGRNNFNFTIELELSLRRFYPGCPKNEVTDERHTLNHS